MRFEYKQRVIPSTRSSRSNKKPSIFWKFYNSHPWLSKEYSRKKRETKSDTTGAEAPSSPFNFDWTAPDVSLGGSFPGLATGGDRS